MFPAGSCGRLEALDAPPTHPTLFCVRRRGSCGRSRAQHPAITELRIRDSSVSEQYARANGLLTAKHDIIRRLPATRRWSCECGRVAATGESPPPRLPQVQLRPQITYRVGVSCTCLQRGDRGRLREIQEVGKGRGRMREGGRRRRAGTRGGYKRVAGRAEAPSARGA